MREKLKSLLPIVHLENLHFESETINVFRIVQEALTNILKYAKATKVKVSLRVVKDRLKIKIEDNGCGFVLKDKSKGLGLITMQERTSLLGGRIEIQSELKKGTSIIVDIPCRRVEVMAISVLFWLMIMKCFGQA